MIQANLLVELSIDNLQELLTSQSITSYQLVMMYLERIKKVDLTINSILELNPDALAIAKALDAERKLSGPRSPIHGIPVLIKDNIDTGDHMHTSAGSLALKDAYALNDSTVARQLRQAGAIILGKTNMTEWANFISENMPSGYSSRGGQVLNPYGPGVFDVGGSSSGSAAAVAANLTAVAVGTETSGSILSPASSNSIVGIKPTVGLISRTGIIPISHTQDTAGPMARTVKDAAILLSILSSQDESDPITLTNPFKNEDFTHYLTIDGLKGKRIGICREGYFDYLDKEKVEIMNQAIHKCEELGAIVIDNLMIPTLKRKWSYDVLVYEFKADLNAYLKMHHKTLKAIMEFNEANKDQALKYGQSIFIEAEATKGTLNEETYLQALLDDHYYAKELGIDLFMKENELDAFVFPNNFGAAIPAKAGTPSITVPAGYTESGEPVGITFSGLTYSEPTLLAIAYAFEQGTLHRKPPKVD